MRKVAAPKPLELLMLAAVMILDDDAYGVTIHQKACELAGEELTLGSVYGALDRLEHRGLLVSWLADPTPERGGRRKRYCRLTALGTAALREAGAAAEP